MESPGKARIIDSNRAMLKANLILSKTIPKDYEHKEEIRYIDNMNTGVVIKLIKLI